MRPADGHESERMGPDYKGTATSMSPDASPECQGEGAARPPVALREPVEHVIHGDRRMDHYAWLRDKKDPRVIAYLNEENAYADQAMGGLAGLQEGLYQE